MSTTHPITQTASVQCDGCRTVVMVRYTPDPEDSDPTDAINLQLGMEHGWTFLTTTPQHFCAVCSANDPSTAKELRILIAEVITQHQLTLDGHTCTCTLDVKFGGMLPRHQGDVITQKLFHKGWIE